MLMHFDKLAFTLLQLFVHFLKEGATIGNCWVSDCPKKSVRF